MKTKTKIGSEDLIFSPDTISEASHVLHTVASLQLNEAWFIKKLLIRNAQKIIIINNTAKIKIVN